MKAKYLYLISAHWSVGNSVMGQRHPSQEASCPMGSAQSQGPNAEDAAATELVNALYSVREWSWPGRVKEGAACGQAFSPWAALSWTGGAGRRQVPAAAG